MLHLVAILWWCALIYTAFASLFILLPLWKGRTISQLPAPLAHHSSPVCDLEQQKEKLIARYHMHWSSFAEQQITEEEWLKKKQELEEEYQALYQKKLTS
ncbi:MAG: hypothetical protein OXC40_08100 [Proteobacteria bacterium]|nr:hypothetical protein [Pseudomonadota bacterium]